MQEKENRKRIGILGSTGSIGRQALEVMAAHPDVFEVDLLTAHHNAELLIEQALRFKPDTVVIGNKDRYGQVSDSLAPKNIKVYAGAESVTQVMEVKKPDMLLTAMVGFAGLAPTLAALSAGIDLALANKETLVVAGAEIMKLARRHGSRIIPVDSEHSAICQCLQGESGNAIEKIILTASGGPFRGRDKAFLQEVTREQALNHPNWDMGAKITIDSATLMNKGLEMIEAQWLFGVEENRIEVIVHPQSVIHSIVQFEDGSMKAQMGLPDMKLPIQYALGFPGRLRSSFPRFDFAKFPGLTFEAPDTDTFDALSLARRAMNKGGTMPCVMNAANEAAVGAFLKGRIRFNDITGIVAYCMDQVPHNQQPQMKDYFTAHEAAMDAADRIISLKKIDNLAG